MEAEAAIPDGALLVHIGPPKTGTTTPQSAMHQHRKELRRHGVGLPGRTSGRTYRQKRPSFGLLGSTDDAGRQVPWRMGRARVGATLPQWAAESVAEHCAAQVALLPDPPTSA